MRLLVVGFHGKVTLVYWALSPGPVLEQMRCIRFKTTVIRARIVFQIAAALILAAPLRVAYPQEVSIPDPGLNAAIRETLQKPTGPLTEPDLLALTQLSAGGQNIASVDGLAAARNLRILDLDANALTNFSIADALTNLTILDLFNNHLAGFVLTNALSRLTILDIGFNSLTQCSLPKGLTNLDTLFLEGNSLTNFSLPAGLTQLRQLDLSGNRLTSVALPSEMTNVVTLLAFANQLTNVTFSSSLPRLAHLDLGFNDLRDLALPPGLTNLSSLRLLGNQLTNLTLSPEMTSLTVLLVDSNPLTTFVLSEPLAATNLAETVATLRSQGVQVLTYPLAVQIVRPRQLTGAFQFGISGPPGVYIIFASGDLAVWSALDAVDNQFGSVSFTDVAAHLSARKFYRAMRQASPANMVFISPNTFLMGSP
jgi:hypothetical protein